MSEHVLFMYSMFSMLLKATVMTVVKISSNMLFSTSGIIIYVTCPNDKNVHPVMSITKSMAVSYF